MKKFVFLCLFCLSALISSAQIDLGIGATGVFSDTQIGPQVRVVVGLQKNLFLSGSFNYFFNTNPNYGFDVDLQYQLLRIGNLSIRPIAGVNIRESLGVGLNFGLCTFIPADSFSIYIEPKYIVDNVSVFSMSVGIMF